MLNLAIIGYALAACAFLGLSALLFVNRRSGLMGWVVIGVAVVGCVWATTLAGQVFTAQGFQISRKLWFGVELLRDASLLIFLAVLLQRSAPTTAQAQRWLRVLRSIAVIIVVSLVVVSLGELDGVSGQRFDLRVYVIALFLILSILGLLLVEQIFRGTAPEQRWTIKFLCLGTGGVFAFDFYMYSEALLFHTIDMGVWSARGYVNALVVPMLGISATRNPLWSVSVVVSRRLIYQSITLLGTGIYLLAMAIAGYYIRLVGGDWGLVGQIVFLFCAILLLFTLMFSGEMRAHTKVFFNKNFFRSKYDYREEWLRITEALSGATLDASLRERALLALAKVVDSTGGVLFQRRGEEYRVSMALNLSIPATFAVARDAPLIRFLIERRWVINLAEYARTPKIYGVDLALPDALCKDPRAWLIVPLLQHETLLGFVVFAQPRAALTLNWEIRDMLLMTGRQVASHLALLDANEALIDARQFEAFNRLSAYVVHDLKNLAAQLSLVVSNATRHRDNPAFINDAINTVANAAEKMNKLLAQLRKGRMEIGAAQRVHIHALAQQAVQQRAQQLPVPILKLAGQDATIIANPERLAAVLEHLIQNAQEATPATGSIQVGVVNSTDKITLTITDNGCGMDDRFIREQLFRPFRTTKGNAGMGIGVYESHEFVQAIGGRLEVSSMPSFGTTFTITLPIDVGLTVVGGGRGHDQNQA